MSNQDKQSTSELFESPATDGTSDDAVLNPEDNEKADESSATIELDGDSKQDSDKSEKAEVMKTKQVEAWTSKVLAGKASLEELTGNQAWLKPLVESQLNKVSASAPVIEKLVEKKFSEREEVAKFETLRNQLNEISTTKTQKQVVEAEFKDFIAAGLPKHKALEKAMKIAGVDQNTTALFKNAARMPRASDYQQPVEKALKELPLDSRIAEYEKMRTKKN